MRIDPNQDTQRVADSERSGSPTPAGGNTPAARQFECAGGRSGTALRLPFPGAVPGGAGCGVARDLAGEGGGFAAGGGCGEISGESG